jgi:hypothetical protein
MYRRLFFHWVHLWARVIGAFQQIDLLDKLLCRYWEFGHCVFISFYKSSCASGKLKFFSDRFLHCKRYMRGGVGMVEVFCDVGAHVGGFCYVIEYCH